MAAGEVLRNVGRLLGRRAAWASRRYQQCSGSIFSPLGSGDIVDGESLGVSGHNRPGVRVDFLMRKYCVNSCTIPLLIT